MSIINATPHRVTLNHEGRFRIYEPCGQVARVKIDRVLIGMFQGFPVYERTFGKIEGLPRERGGVRYIVSSLVLEQAKREGRLDCLTPDITTAHRDRARTVLYVSSWIA
jgi:hypothetical protein